MKTLLARLVLVVSIALVPALAFQAYTETQARHIRQLLVEDEALRLVRLASSELQRIAEGAEQVLDAISSAPAVQDNLPELCQRLMSNLLQRSPRYNSAAIFGLDGHYRCAPAERAPALDVSDRAYFRLALQTGGFAIGDYAVGRGSGKPTLHMAKPVRNRDGVVTGVAEVGLSVDWLGQQIERLTLPAKASVLITDRNGTILARRPDWVGMVGTPMPAARHFTLEGDEVKVVHLDGLDGSKRIVAYSPPAADPKGLRTGVGLDRDTSFAAFTQANRTGLLLICAGIGWAVLMTALLGGRLIRRPLDRLLGAADRWRTGDLAARIALRADGSEFARLAAAFDRMAMAQEARESALRTALESTTDNVLVLDRSWRITYLNARAKALVAPARDVLGQTYWEAFPGVAASPFGRAYRAAMERGVPAHVSAPSVISPYYFDAHAYPSEDGLTVFFHDVTEERRIAAALREREEMFRATFEQAAVGMGLAALDETILDVNGKLCAITGYSREELLARHFTDITHPDDLDLDRSSKRSLLAGEIASLAIEKRYLRKDGTVVWVNLTASLLRDFDGQAQRFVGVVEDITSRKHAEAALRESETRLQLAREAAGCGIWDWDLTTDRAIWSEEKWQQHGFEPQPGAPDPKIWWAGVHPEDRDRLAATWAAAFADPAKSCETEYRVVWPDGTVRWLLAQGIVVRGTGGKPLRLVGLSVDVTERRETEAALRRLTTDLEARVREEVAAREAAQARAAQAERLQALGQLAGGIAHDFNNVLQAIAGAAAMIEIHPGDEANVLRFASRASGAVERGASITRRLLSFGRRADLRAEPLDVATLLAGLNDMLAPTLGAAIDVHVTSEPGLPPVLADRGQMETVLVNLATNARDAMPQGGRLTLAAATDIASAYGPAHEARLPPGRYVRLSVADSGIGMDADTLARACEPFFTTKGSGAGTGLGLAMAKGFAEQSGGAISLASNRTHGTTVTLWLPAAAPDTPLVAREPHDAPGPGAPASAARVLLVDDEDMVREVLAVYLQSTGHDVLVAANGAEALALLDSGEAVDVLVTDLSMPGMDGMALIRAVQERTPGLPAVLLTGYVGDCANRDMGGAGAWSLLRKPVDGRQLVDCIDALLKA